jgi:hypothetical protein
MTRTIDFLGF